MIIVMICREILAAYGGVHLEDIRGMRAPFLAIGVFILTLTILIILMFFLNDFHQKDWEIIDPQFYFRIHDMAEMTMVVILLYDSGKSHVFNATWCQLHIWLFHANLWKQGNFQLNIEERKFWRNWITKQFQSNFITLKHIKTSKECQKMLKNAVGKVFQKSNERKRQKCTWNPKRGKNASRNTAIPHWVTFPLLLQPTKNGD